MTTSPQAIPPVDHRSALGRAVRGLACRVGYDLGVLPVAMAGLGAVLIGDYGRAVRWQRERVRRLLGPGYAVGDAPAGPARAAVHGVLGVGLGLLGWFLVFLVLFTMARGPFYGLVVDGPYTDAWGGPSLIGAWTVHALVWLALLPIGFGLWWGLASVHGRLTARLLGGELHRIVHHRGGGGYRPMLEHLADGQAGRRFSNDVTPSRPSGELPRSPMLAASGQFSVEPT